MGIHVLIVWHFFVYFFILKLSAPISDGVSFFRESQTLVIVPKIKKRPAKGAREARPFVDEAFFKLLVQFQEIAALEN